MVKSEIISKLSKKIHQKLKKSELEEILNIVLETIIQGIKDGRSSELRDFGRFSPKKLKDDQTLEILEVVRLSKQVIANLLHLKCLKNSNRKLTV